MVEQADKNAAMGWMKLVDAILNVAGKVGNQNGHCAGSFPVRLCSELRQHTVCV